MSRIRVNISRVRSLTNTRLGPLVLVLGGTSTPTVLSFRRRINTIRGQVHPALMNNNRLNLNAQFDGVNNRLDNVISKLTQLRSTILDCMDLYEHADLALRGISYSTQRTISDARAFIDESFPDDIAFHMAVIDAFTSMGIEHEIYPFNTVYEILDLIWRLDRTVSRDEAAVSTDVRTFPLSLPTHIQKLLDNYLASLGPLPGHEESIARDRFIRGLVKNIDAEILRVAMIEALQKQRALYVERGDRARIEAIDLLIERYSNFDRHMEEKTAVTWQDRIWIPSLNISLETILIKLFELAFKVMLKKAGIGFVYSIISLVNWINKAGDAVAHIKSIRGVTIEDLKELRRATAFALAVTEKKYEEITLSISGNATTEQSQALDMLSIAKIDAMLVILEIEMELVRRQTGFQSWGEIEEHVRLNRQLYEHGRLSTGRADMFRNIVSALERRAEIEHQINSLNALDKPVLSGIPVSSVGNAFAGQSQSVTPLSSPNTAVGASATGASRNVILT